MIELLEYDAEFDEEIGRMNPEFLWEIRKHGDVIAESVTVAVSYKDDGADAGSEESKSDAPVFAGAGFLMETPFYIDAEFMSVPGSETEIEASFELLSVLQDLYGELAEADPKEKRPLRLFCNEHFQSYREVLEEYGFSVEKKMLVMKKDLRALPDFQVPENIREIDLSDQGIMDEYMRVNAQAFQVPDSRKDMLFRTAYRDAHVFAAMDGRKLLSAVTIWPLKNGAGATENIFTEESERRKGYAEKMIRTAWQELRARGFETARLTVYEDDAPAIRLYEKLGYEESGRLLEMCFGVE